MSSSPWVAVVSRVAVVAAPVGTAGTEDPVDTEDTVLAGGTVLAADSVDPVDNEDLVDTAPVFLVEIQADKQEDRPAAAVAVGQGHKVVEQEDGVLYFDSY